MPTLTKPCRFTRRRGRGRPQTSKDGRKLYLSRVILEGKLGRPIKPGFHALHHCNNGLCIEEEHIYEGTPSNNLIDSYNAGKSSGNDTKTHCNSGHAFNPKNTYYHDRRRACRECHRIREVARRAQACR